MSETNKVYAWCNQGIGTDMQLWFAMAEDGEVLASHMSSSRAWGQRDVGPEGFYKDRYVEKFGERFMDTLAYEVVPEGKVPPDDVCQRNQERAKTEGGGTDADA